ncbi:hypothetical protein ACFW04_000584 [Cataglyphis niger]
MRNFCSQDAIYIISMPLLSNTVYHIQAHRALELLEDYHAKLTRPQDKQLRLAIERVIRIFKSRLFQALLAKKWNLRCLQKLKLFTHISIACNE